MPAIEIDEHSGFCFGVVTAIRKAEEELTKTGKLYCLGDIVHNSDEVERLRRKGLITITHDEFARLRNVKVLLRAHGEPPSTYELARRNSIEIIDATCPVVLQLQRRIKQAADTAATTRPQIVIYGKTGHAEVNGLVGQTDGEAIVVESPDDLHLIDPDRPVLLYSQTTKSISGLQTMINEIRRMMHPDVPFESFDTICRQVANRADKLKAFAAGHDVVLFVGGRKSSNGRFLYTECCTVNPHTHFIANESELRAEWLDGAESIGICGATSTPRWLMENVRERTKSLLETESNPETL